MFDVDERIDGKIAKEASIEGSFPGKVKLIRSCQRVLSSILQQKPDREILQKYIQSILMDIMSDIPGIVISFIQSHNKKGSNFRIERIIEKIFHHLQEKGYNDYMTDEESHILGIRSIYNDIFHYLQRVNNNITLFKQYKDNPTSLLSQMYPKNAETITNSEITMELKNGIIIFVIDDSLMDAIGGKKTGGFYNEYRTESTFLLYATGGNICPYIITKKSGKRLNSNERLLYMLFGVYNEPVIIRHELQHAYNNIYMNKDQECQGIRQELYAYAKNEIIAQLQDYNKKNRDIIEVMKSDLYNYIDKKLLIMIAALKRKIKYINHQLERFNNNITPDYIRNKLQESERKLLQLRIQDLETLESPIKLKELRTEYHKIIAQYIERGVMFRDRCTDNGIADAFVILAKIPIDERDKLALLLELKDIDYIKSQVRKHLKIEYTG